MTVRELKHVINERFIVKYIDRYNGEVDISKLDRFEYMGFLDARIYLIQPSDTYKNGIEVYLF